MAQIRLPVSRVFQHDLFPQTYLDERGTVQPFPWLKLRTHVLIGADPTPSRPGEALRYDPATDHRVTVQAILDTGASVTVFPRRHWQAFEPQITRLPFNPDELALRGPAERSPVASVGGVTFPYFLGRVWVGAFDIWARRLPAVQVLAMFREDVQPPGQPLPNVLLGLSAGLLEGRRLERSPIDMQYDPDPPGLQTFGQWWWLSDW